MSKLSEREVQVIEAVSNGQSLGEFAREHDIAKQTVSAYVCRAKEKLGATTLGQACVKYRETS